MYFECCSVLTKPFTYLKGIKFIFLIFLDFMLFHFDVLIRFFHHGALPELVQPFPEPYAVKEETDHDCKDADRDEVDKPNVKTVRGLVDVVVDWTQKANQSLSARYTCEYLRRKNYLL